LGAVALLGIISAGCQEKALKAENVELRQENRNLQAKLADTETRLRSAPDPGQLSAMQQELANRDAQIAQLQNQLRQPAPGQTPSGLEGIEVTRDTAAGTVTVNLPGDVLFASGEAELRPAARTTLAKVVAAIKRDYPGKKVFVDGYTDTDPISRTRDKFEDNLDLSAARARAVQKFLIEQGLAANQVGIRAFGDTKPRNSKAASRRVEVVVSAR
jgi:flagellar motor protein MotB